MNGVPSSTDSFHPFFATTPSAQTNHTMAFAVSRKALNVQAKKTGSKTTKVCAFIDCCCSQGQRCSSTALGVLQQESRWTDDKIVYCSCIQLHLAVCNSTYNSFCIYLASRTQTPLPSLCSLLTPSLHLILMFSPSAEARQGCILIQGC